jgi:lon-related putative ATP-dependent protease
VGARIEYLAHAAALQWLHRNALERTSMFFDQFKKKSNASNGGAAPSSAPMPENGPLAPAIMHSPLPVSDLRRMVDAQSLGFASTADLDPAIGLIGQERALKAIDFGAKMDAQDFNIFVLGPPASGKSTAVRSYLERKTETPAEIYDWVYVNNFDDNNNPRALRLPCGRAASFEKGMVDTIDELRQTLPSVFEDDEYQGRRRQIDDGFRAGQEEALEALTEKAREQNIAILRTPTGIGMAPMLDGKVVKPEIFAGLPEEMRKNVEAKVEVLQKELGAILEDVPKSEKERRSQLRKLNEEIANAVVTEALSDVREAHAGIPEIIKFLDRVGRDMVRNFALFFAQEEEDGQPVQRSVDTTKDPRFRRYLVNIMVGHDQPDYCTQPIVEELNPNYGNLIGRIEHVAHMGSLVTDFLLMKPGALHRANGGYLLVDARKLLLSPFAWEALKRAIKAQKLRIEQPEETNGFASTQSIDPEPIPLDVKVVLFGDRQLYYTLAAGDPDFNRLFKVQADFDDTINRTEENQQSYARLIAAIVKRHDLRHVDASGVARLIDEGSRFADDREKLSIEVGTLADLVREADYWAGEIGADLIDNLSVGRAIEERIQRSDRLRDRSQEGIERDMVLIETDGEKVGQINALSVLQLGDFAFGKPTRITARARMGKGRVTDIEREVNLGGALHSKGVMILWGYLAGKFAEDIPLALAASLVFEQSYGGVDGDSASSTELYALLSALAQVPIKQNFAVTGSVNQMGEVQVIGGANEKIEGFFDICKSRGLTGNQGVLIPQGNVQHLMLRPEIVEAVQHGQFNIYGVSTVDQGIEILTGIAAGEKGADGRFPPGTINRRVEDQLRAFAHHVKHFASSNGGGTV